MAKVKINPDQLKRKLATRFVQSNQRLAEIFDEEFTESKWSWPRSTRRANGQLVHDPRNIIDSGELKNSRSLTLSADGTRAKHRWSAAHAALVLLGGRTATGKVIPPRNWILSGLKQAKGEKLF